MKAAIPQRVWSQVSGHQYNHADLFAGMAHLVNRVLFFKLFHWPHSRANLMYEGDRCILLCKSRINDGGDIGTASTGKRHLQPVVLPHVIFVFFFSQISVRWVYGHVPYHWSTYLKTISASYHHINAISSLGFDKKMLIYQFPDTFWRVLHRLLLVKGLHVWVECE